MSTDLAAQRLLAYRKFVGISQSDLANLVGVSANTVSLIERGRRNFDLNVTPLHYRTDRFKAFPTMSEPLHRAKASTLVSARERAKELIRLAGEIFIELAPTVETVPKPLLPRIPEPFGPVEVDEAAEEVRVGVLGQERDTPITNLTALIERAGIILVPIVGLPDIDGLSSWVEFNGEVYPVIGIDPSKPGDRYRLTLLHEVGHLAMHRRSSETAEDQANSFARSVLIPTDRLEQLFEGSPPTLSDFVRAKSTWGVSVAALIYGSHRLGFIDDKRYRSLQIQMARWKRKEPGHFPSVPGGLLPQLVEASGGTAAVADKLGIDPHHVRDVTNWQVLRSV